MQWLLGLALLSAVFGALAPWERLSIATRRWASTALMVLQASPFVVLMWLFIADDIAYEIVRLHGGADMPIAYRISAAWGGREGPLLLWAGILTVCAYWFGRNGATDVGPTRNLRQRLTQGFILALLAIAWLLEPFRPAVGIGRSELNPLLQTDLMVIHPPLVFLFYSLCMLVSIHSLAALLDPDSEGELPTPSMLHIARAGLLTGALAIGLGGLWAYTVLDWGGYWAWDPVETGSLLPWLCLLMLLHLRITPGRPPSRWAVALGLLPGWFALHATMVTRANGVWASVHAFVAGSGSGERPDSALGRLLELRANDVAGTEVTTYLVALFVMLFLLIAWLMLQQSGLAINRRHWRYAVFSSLALVVAIPISRLMFVYSIGFDTSPLETIPAWLLLTLCALPLLVVWLPPQKGFSRLLDTPARALPMLAVCALAPMLGDPVVAGLSVLVMMLHISVRGGRDTVWTWSGALLLLFASWAFLVDTLAAFVGMLLFLGPGFLGQPDEDSVTLGQVREMVVQRKVQLRLVRFAPVVLVASFLTLSWMLLLSSIDGASLSSHELFGAPLLLLAVAALTTYAWRDALDSRLVPALLLLALALSVILALAFDLPLPGDSTGPLSEQVSRGQVAWMLLPLLLLAAPALFRFVLEHGKRLRAARERSPASGLAALRPAAAHLAHLGIILLLIGHLFTTTLVDRTDPAHQVVLPRGEIVEHSGMQLLFTDWVMLSEEDPEFDERFSVGDGYLGATIEVRDSRGELIDVVEPGVLRFDGYGSFPRSEVDRTLHWSGDVVFIFDWTQAQQLGNESMLGGADELDRVRLTVYDLPGSHLVWTGWLFLLFATLANWRAWAPSKHG